MTDTPLLRLARIVDRWFNVDELDVEALRVEAASLVRDLEAAPQPETERREIASFRGLRYWCASCMAHFGALLPDGDVCCNDCGLIITSVKKDA